jgi:tetrahydromethanopterin S-methyltransferase subunit G
VEARASFSVPVILMTSDDRLSLILLRLDEIERKLDRMRHELRPMAIGYSPRRGNRPRKG